MWEGRVNGLSSCVRLHYLLMQSCWVAYVRDERCGGAVVSGASVDTGGEREAVYCLVVRPTQDCVTAV